MSTKPCFSDNRCEASLNVTGVAADVDTADDGVSHDGDEHDGAVADVGEDDADGGAGDSDAVGC